jgi:mannose-1-phosphate guanylyltransferase
MLEFHRSHQKEGTIAVTKVKDPSKYGVILSDEKGKILNFIEKPQIFIGDNINAGLYIFNKNFLDRVEPKPISLEREIFPKMAQEEQLYVFQLPGFWADIGQPRDYLIGTSLFLQDLENTDQAKLSKGNNIIGNVLVVIIIKIG